MTVHGPDHETNGGSSFRETAGIGITTTRRTNRNFLFAWPLLVHGISLARDAQSSFKKTGRPLGRSL